jgi:hypothetical protein
MALSLLAAAVFSTPLLAQQATKKFDYKPVKDIQDIGLAVDKVRINQLVFKAPKPDSGPLRRSSAECVARIDNDGQAPVAVGVAVVLMDEAGNIVAAGSGGTRMGFLSAGERDAATIRFPYLYRNLSKAKTFIVTMEVEGKPAREEKPATTPEPTP